MHRIGATSSRRLLVAAVVGVAVGLVTGLPFTWRIALLCGWDSSVLVLLAWLWPTIWPMDGDETAAHAVREDPSKPLADVLIIAASLASLGGVALVIEGGKQHGTSKTVSITVALVSVLLSWTMVHSNFTTRYAKLYYSGPDGGIDFKSDDKPRYSDFAYVAFTLGMTYQVADTDLQSSDLRKVVLRHALLSYVFGAVIIAATINLVAGLSG